MGMLPTMILRKISAVCPSIAKGFPPLPKRKKNGLAAAAAPPPPTKKNYIYPYQPLQNTLIPRVKGEGET